jgi:ParB/RepB/Spo0J family partition protein
MMAPSKRTRQEKESYTMSGTLKVIGLAEIRRNKVALRDVLKDTETYQGLVDSIKQVGIMNPISVREKVDELGVKFFELVDGLHRFSAASDAGLTEIPVQIVDLDDDMILEAQLIANIHKQETRPVEYSNQLRRIMARNALMTISELAQRISRSPTWIEQRLSLNKIDNPQLKELINSGRINLTNAFAIAKLPADEQTDFTEWAMTEPPETFVQRVKGRQKELREARRTGAESPAPEFEAKPHMRKLSELCDDDGIRKAAVTLAGELDSAVDGFIMGVKFCTNLDPISIEASKAKFDARQAELSDKRQKRKVEAAARKAAKAEHIQKEAANAQAEVEGRPLPFPNLGKAPVEISEDIDADDAE